MQLGDATQVSSSETNRRDLDELVRDELIDLVAGPVDPRLDMPEQSTARLGHAADQGTQRVNEDCRAGVDDARQPVKVECGRSDQRPDTLGCPINMGSRPAGRLVGFETKAEDVEGTPHRDRVRRIHELEPENCCLVETVRVALALVAVW